MYKPLYHCNSDIPLEYITKSISKLPGKAVPCPNEPPSIISLTTISVSSFK